MNALPSIPSIDYPTVFLWREDTILLADIAYKAYLDIFITALHHSIKSFDETVWSALRSLPTESQQRIIEAPETYARLNAVLRGEREAAWMMEFIRDSICVERVRQGYESKEAYHKWSANGDLFCDHPTAPSKFCSSGWRIGGCFYATKIGSIPIDHSSPYVRTDMPVADFRSVQYGMASPFEIDEAQVAESKIIDAFLAINKSVPFAGRFIDRYVSSIVLRKNVDDLEVFQSASRNAYIGQIVLLNPHCFHVDVPYVAESLVHEAIHSLMWRQEILSHFLIDPNKDMGTVRSPWSGEEIYFYTLLQAVFVWYGIAWFWAKAIKTAVFPKSRAEFLLERALHGFCGDQLMATLSRYESNLNPGIMSVFLSMRNKLSELTEVQCSA